MKYIRKFENMQHLKRGGKLKNTKTNEMVTQFDDVYRVKVPVDIPKSVVNSYVKKVKDAKGIDLRSISSDSETAELLVKHVIDQHLDVEQIPSNVIVGGADDDVIQSQSQFDTQAQPQAQLQAQPQAQLDDEGFDDTESIQVQTQGQGQAQSQDFEDPQAQVQSQAQVQLQSQDEIQDDEDFGESQDDEELPL